MPVFAGEKGVPMSQARWRETLASQEITCVNCQDILQEDSIESSNQSNTWFRIRRVRKEKGKSNEMAEIEEGYPGSDPRWGLTAFRMTG